MKKLGECCLKRSCHNCDGELTVGVVNKPSWNESHKMCAHHIEVYINDDAYKVTPIAPVNLREILGL